jgi:hypothetical protein
MVIFFDPVTLPASYSLAFHSLFADIHGSASLCFQFFFNVCPRLIPILPGVLKHALTCFQSIRSPIRSISCSFGGYYRFGLPTTWITLHDGTPMPKRGVRQHSSPHRPRDSWRCGCPSSLCLPMIRPKFLIVTQELPHTRQLET